MAERRAIERAILDRLQAMDIIPGLWQRPFTIPSPGMEEALAQRRIAMPQLAKVIGYRLDAVVTNHEHTIIEAKPTQDPRAIGQLLVYKDLYSRYKKIPVDRIKLVHAFAVAKPELDQIFAKHNIKLIHIPLTT